jgi:hypothetical protein
MRMNAQPAQSDTRPAEVPDDKPWEFFLDLYADRDWLLKQSSTLIINAARLALQAQQSLNNEGDTPTPKSNKTTAC